MNETYLKEHKLNKLSDLDKQIIDHVPPGGNWSDIPEDIPSKRLEQIRQMAEMRGMVRTTYYSRLKYDQPSYTISTYFNRPGNGANIHPWENRTISSREAARLQSFPDSFSFVGKDSDIRKQIGNAVPPLLSYALAKELIKTIGKDAVFADVFAGAGGLSYGFELAGLNGVAALEIDKNASLTYECNHNSSISVINGDINCSSTMSEFINVVKCNANGKKLILIGGPPCQGFSTAGYRQKNDPRNKLVQNYLDLIQELSPSIVVIENVQGILSMDHGNVIKNIYSSLSSLGYFIIPEPWVLNAECYGVPQMRKRVFIIAGKSKLDLPNKPKELFSKCLGRREPINYDKDNISPPYPITVGEALFDLPNLLPVNSYYPFKYRFDEIYSQWLKGEISTDAFLQKRTS